ncbi:TfpX/TfpZ family type IV pilin accessory protein [Rhodoferax sp.]|uniref:TfpX/TfpZ family type IV pilin accessory protein n=1 Tax=Rhodoferax sp. TaxID=50421 RepID=UPI002747D445|nr:TfpX/TfpZ family type IV pilin accessory protein [Rhodoferax sp.]
MRAAFWHLCASAAVAIVASALVFGLWYPHPYREVAGGEALFLLIVGVDLICGPLLTAVLFNPVKSRRELTVDLSLVVSIQVAALVYGLYSVAMARPVVLAFEVDRFRVVAAADFQASDLKLATADMQLLSWTGPKLVGTRAPNSSDERLRSLELSIQGQEPGSRPGWWQPYDLSRPEVMQRAKSLSSLRTSRPDSTEAIDRAARQTGLAVDELLYLPLVSHRRSDWVVLLDAAAAVRGFAPVDGF